MTSMIERIARAIIGPREQVPAGSPYTLEQLREVRWNQTTRHKRDDALWAAKAVLRELREPTEMMELAAQEALPEWDDENDCYRSPMFVAEFRAAIDAEINAAIDGEIDVEIASHEGSK